MKKPTQIIPPDKPINPTEAVQYKVIRMHQRRIWHSKKIYRCFFQASVLTVIVQITVSQSNSTIPLHLSSFVELVGPSTNSPSPFDVPQIRMQEALASVQSFSSRSKYPIYTHPL